MEYRDAAQLSGDGLLNLQSTGLIERRYFGSRDYAY